MPRQVILWENKQNDITYSYVRFNNNMEAHAEIYPLNGHFEISIDLICTSVSLEYLQKKLLTHDINMKIIDQIHMDYQLRGECLLYQETVSSVRDGKIRFEIWRDDMLRIFNL